MFVLVLPAQLLSGRRDAPPVFYPVFAFFLPSFLGVFVCEYLERRRSGAAFGRNCRTDDPLPVTASSYQTKRVTKHTVETLAIQPTLRDRMLPVILMALPFLWYVILGLLWLFTPEVYATDDSRIAVVQPFVLPLPFIVVAIVLLANARSFCFDRSERRLIITSLWKTRSLPLDQIKAVQLIRGEPILAGSNDRKRRRRTYTTVQLNLVTSDHEFPRINIAHDAAKQANHQIALILSEFLGVELDDRVHD